jgi:polysaccharide biosynthesis transport protein
MDLVYLFKILYKRIWIIVTVPIVAGVASFFFTQNIEKKYKSTAQLAAGFTTNNKVQLSKENFDYWESKSKFENLVETMKSELIGSMVVYNLLLYDLEKEKPFRDNTIIEMKFPVDTVRRQLSKKIESFTLLSYYDEFENGILDMLNKKNYTVARWIKDGDLKISRVNDTDFIRVEFTSENPFLSAFVVNKLCEEYIRYNSAIKNAVTEESLLFFSNEVEKKKNELEVITEQLNSVKNTSQVYNYDRESNSKLSQVADLEIKLQEEESKNAALIISLKSVEAKISSLTTNSEVSTNAKLLELKNKINELNKIYTDNGSSDKNLEATINELRNQLQIEIQKIDVGNPTVNRIPKTLQELKIEQDEIELEVAISNSNLVAIRNKINSLKNNVSAIGSKEYVIASLERERENAFKEYTSFVEKLNEVKSRSLITGSGPKLMIAGQPNPKPEPSKRVALIGIAFIGALFLCLGYFLVAEYFDNRLKTPDKFERYTKIKLLGYLNQIVTRESDFPFTMNKGKDAMEIELMMNLLRKIRFNIEISSKKVVLVTSTNTGDGKSFFIKSLAQSLSLLNKRVLIIDTNFRNNSLSQLILGYKMLQQPAELKLLNDATMHYDNETIETDRSIIFSTSDKNVDIIGSRQGFESPSEMFAGKDFNSLIRDLGLKYDYILMEGPALNSYSDTKELVQYADVVISVFSAKKSLTQKDRDSIKYLKVLNGKFIGAVLNFVHEDEVNV